MEKFEIDFTDKEITPWGGISLMRQMLQKMDIERVLTKISLPEQGSNRGYSPIQLILNFWVGIWCGANRFEHLEVTRQDEVIKDIFSRERMPGSKSFQRYFQKFNQATNERVFDQLYGWFFDNLHFDNYTPDFDSTVMTRYGEQEGAKRGYNPQKKGRKQHHPLLAFISDIKMIANLWLRAGNTGASTNFFGFLEDTLSKLQDKRVGLIRCDSGFYGKDIFEYLEGNNPKKVTYPYIIAAKFYLPLKRKLAGHHPWLVLDEGLEIGESTYQAEDWDKPRRIIMIRQEITKRPKAVGKQLGLFEDETIYKNYRYSCYVTDSDLPTKTVYDLYRGRCDSENRIKEIKYDFGGDSFNVRDFWATEAALNFVMMAYNLMSLFRQVILGGQSQPFLKTIRYRAFAIGAYFIKDGNSRILKLSLAMKRRTWFMGLWNKSSAFEWPFSPA